MRRRGQAEAVRPNVSGIRRVTGRTGKHSVRDGPGTEGKKRVPSKDAAIPEKNDANLRKFPREGFDYDALSAASRLGRFDRTGDNASFRTFFQRSPACESVKAGRISGADLGGQER